MKLFYILSRPLLLVIFLTSMASGGTRDGGGGNGRRATPEEVRNYILGIKVNKTSAVMEPNLIFDTRIVLDRLEKLRNGSAGSIISTRLQRVLNSMSTSLASSSALTNILTVEVVEHLRVNRMSWNPIPSGPCVTENGERRDSSLKTIDEKNRKYFEICFSVERLTRFSKESLRTQIPALLLHELVHAALASANEDNPKYVQNFILEKLTPPCQFEIWGGGADEDKMFLLTLDDFENYSQVQACVHKANGSICRNSNANAKILSSLNGGRLSFNALNSDFSLSEQSLEWGKTTPGGLYAFLSEQIAKSKMTWDGQPFTPRGIGFRPWCDKRF